jgi:dihydroneopterin aldolase
MFLGLASTERSSHQWVDWNIVFEFDSNVSATSGELKDSIDYVTALGEMKFLLWFGRFYLLETAVNFLADYFLQRYPQLLAVEVASIKKEALGDGRYPTLRIRRDQKSEQAREQAGKVYIERFPDLKCALGPQTAAHDLFASQGENKACFGLCLSGPQEKLGKTVLLPSTEDFNALVCLADESPYPIELVSKYPLSKNAGDQLDVFSVSFFNPVLHTYVK